MTHSIASPLISTAGASTSRGHRVALFRWQGHAVSIGAAPELIDTLSELMGLEYEAAQSLLDGTFARKRAICLGRRGAANSRVHTRAICSLRQPRSFHRC